ncbi:MAG TPA: hypothetical protein DER09_03005 [Prolixibacteraceae bacterium]|nr:hypothetical protein [Prolixibacteraceae bacterium]
MKQLLLLALFGLSMQSAHTQTLGNNWFSLIFDSSRGSLTAVKTSGDTLFSGAVNAIISDGKIHLSNGNNYRFTIKQIIGSDGNQVLLVSGKDKNRKLDFTQQITLFSNMPAIGFEVIYKNVSGKNINIRSLEPLRLVQQNSGILYFGNAEKCLTNGAMYYDAGNIQNLSKPWIRPEPYGETKGGVMSDTLLTANPLTAQSWWNISLFTDTETTALTVGYLLNANTLGRLQMLKHDGNQLSLVAESVLNPGFILKPGQEISSDQLVLVTGENVYKTNENYASLMQEKMNNPACSVMNGWCNWFYTMDVFSENEILENAVFAANHLKSFGLEYIQIDEGFQTTHGDWQGNKRFPHGLKWLCDSIKSLGLKPGIWIAPFVIAENSEVYKNHPDWLLKDKNGKPVRIGPWPSENTDWYRSETPKRYCLDLTHPAAEKWYTALIDTIANHWGFEMIKVDFVAWTVFSAQQFYNTGATPAQVYRHALEIMRKKAGENCHILDCGPGHVSGGYINSMRIEYDQNYGNSDNAWTQYFRGNSSSAGAAGKRWFYNNKTWTNDIDHVCIDLLAEHEAKAAATLIGLSGGNVMSGDRLMNLGPVKMEILKKIFPATPENGVPVDLAENDPQTIFTCAVEKPFGNWQVVAFFNTDREKPRQKIVVLKKLLTKLDPPQISPKGGSLGKVNSLQLESGKTYLTFDFWEQRFAGEVTDTLQVNVNPGSVALYSLRPKTGEPQIIGTNRHVKMGAVELTAEKYDAATLTLTATSLGPEDSAHSVFVYLPDGYGWQPRDSKIYEINPLYSVRQTDPNLLRIDLQFTNSTTIDWKITVQKY